MASPLNDIRADAAPLIMVVRGVRVRCPRCGGKNLFASYFTLRERCPTCGYKIARDDGFFLGGYVMNVVIGEALLGVFLFAFAARILSHPDTVLAPWLVTAAALAILPPIVLFKMSRTTWMAMDLLLHPLEPWEVAEADLAIEKMGR